MDILEQLRGPHEWGYRGLAGEGFIKDDAPIKAADEIERLREAVDDEKASRLAIEKTNIWFLRAQAAEKKLAAITAGKLGTP